jgi:hypothetical protein
LVLPLVPHRTLVLLHMLVVPLPMLVRHHTLVDPRHTLALPVGRLDYQDLLVGFSVGYKPSSSET